MAQHNGVMQMAPNFGVNGAMMVTDNYNVTSSKVWTMMMEPRKAITLGNRQSSLSSRQDSQCTVRAQPSSPAAVMFHPPKIPQRQQNGNGTGFQWVPVENPLNADVAPVADPFFQPLLAVVGSTAIVENATGSLICLIVTVLQRVTRCNPLGSRCDSNGCRF